MTRQFGSVLNVAIAVVLLLIGCAPQKLQFPPSPEARASGGHLYKPDGAGPFPAVVLLHTCGGIRGHIYAWAEKFRRADYVVMVVDSLTPRGAQDNCRRQAVSVDDVAGDALDALAHLRSLSYVSSSRIAVVGFSFGGMAALRLASESYVKRLSSIQGFRAAVAFYPHCKATDSKMSYVLDNLYGDVSVPLLMLLGGQDAEAPASLCAESADELRRNGRPVSYKIYADATHGFDQGGMGWRGDAYFYDANATEDSRNEIGLFLGKQLK